MAHPVLLAEPHSNSKLAKSLARGYGSYALHLSPATHSGYNVCPFATETCSAFCVSFEGKGKYAYTQEKRIAKTRGFFEDRKAFLATLETDIRRAIKRQENKGRKACFRLNASSDLPWEKIAPNLFDIPGAIFYDYTKNAKRMLAFLAADFPANYHLTFSRSESNDKECAEITQKGGNVAIVFRTIPETYAGRYVIDGDRDDLRFLDPKGIVAIKAKGKGMRNEKKGFALG